MLKILIKAKGKYRANSFIWVESKSEVTVKTSHFY